MDGGVDSAVADTGASTDSAVTDSGTGTDSGVVTDSGTDTGDAGDAGRDYNYVFVTSTMQQIAFATGRRGADDLCNGLAVAAGLPGNYVAWLSVSGGTEPNAADRLSHPRGGWRLVGGGGSPGALVASSKGDLLDGDIDHEIDRTESGGLADFNPMVITGTLADGRAVGTTFADSCINWTSTTPAAVKSGRTGRTDHGWTASGDASCSNSVRLYCFEV